MHTIRYPCLARWEAVMDQHSLTCRAGGAAESPRSEGPEQNSGTVT